MYYREGHFGLAIKHLTKAVAISPESSTANSFLAVALRRQGEYGEALRHHEIALRYARESFFVRNAYAYTIAEALSSGGNLDRSYTIENAESALETAKSSLRSKRDRTRFTYLSAHTEGLILYVRKKLAGAVKTLDKAISSIGEQEELMPRDKAQKLKLALYHRALAFGGLGRLKDAKKDFRRSITNSRKEIEQRPEWYWYSDAMLRLRKQL